MIRRSPSLRVLVVDDDPVLIDLIPWLLSVLGHIVETAATGQLALQRLTAPPPLDAILIDLRMPCMDGATLAAAIAALPHPPHLIGMSGGEPTAEQAIHFNVFLRKPFGMEDLKQALNDSTPRPATQLFDSDTLILDKATYNRLADSMSSAKLQDLYTRTLDYIRQTAPAFDSAIGTVRSELAHGLQGSCAMVGAVELATLAGRLDHVDSSILDSPPGASLESSISYKILRAAERLERILNSQ